MTIQTINVGLAANDGTGDDLREAFIKVNQNFQNLENIAEQTGFNIGLSGAGVFAGKIGNVLNFRKLIGTGDVSIIENNSTINITSNVNTGFVISGDSGSLSAGAGINIDLLGSGLNSIQIDNNTKTITVTGRVLNDNNPTLGASLNANNFNITAVNNFTATNNLLTNLSLTNINGVNYYDRLGKYVQGFDLGGINYSVNSILDWVILQVGIDLGSITTPSEGNIDFGTFI